jgi:hypothetical protein
LSRKIPERVLTHWAPAFGIVGVILYYALFLYQHALNIPYADDIFDVLEMLNGVVQSEDLNQTITLLFAQHIEHRTLASRLIYCLQFLVAGEIDFRVLVFLANLALPLLLLLFYIAVRKQARPLWVIFPAALVLFQLRAYHLVFWSMAAFAYLFVYMYAFASLSCLRNVSFPRFLAALVFASLASFSLASGQLIWLVGLVSLLHQSLALRRASLIYSLCWIFCAVAVLSVWHMEFEPMVSVSFLLKSLVAMPLYPIPFFLALIGNAVSASNLLLAQGLGVVALCLVGYYSVRMVAKEDVTLELFVWYIILSAFSIALARSPLAGLESALHSRYSLPSLLLVATLLVLMASQLDSLQTNRRGVFALLILTLLSASFWGYSFHTYRPALQRLLESTVNNYNHEVYWALYVPPEETKAIVAESISLGIYQPPARPNPKPIVAPPPSKGGSP